MKKRIVLPAAGLMLAALAALNLAGVLPNRISAGQTRGYQAVLLDNGQVYYGRIAHLDSAYPVLTDVFYVQQAINPETKQASNILLKRGKEWHAPDETMLSARHIVMVEPVTAGSAVAKLIQQAEGK